MGRLRIGPVGVHFRQVVAREQDKANDQGTPDQSHQNWKYTNAPGAPLLVAMSNNIMPYATGATNE